MVPSIAEKVVPSSDKIYRSTPIAGSSMRRELHAGAGARPREVLRTMGDLGSIEPKLLLWTSSARIALGHLLRALQVKEVVLEVARWLRTWRLMGKKLAQVPARALIVGPKRSPLGAPQCPHLLLSGKRLCIRDRIHTSTRENLDDLVGGAGRMIDDSN